MYTRPVPLDACKAWPTVAKGYAGDPSFESLPALDTKRPWAAVRHGAVVGSTVGSHAAIAASTPVSTSEGASLRASVLPWASPASSCSSEGEGVKPGQAVA